MVLLRNLSGLVERNIENLYYWDLKFGEDFILGLSSYIVLNKVSNFMGKLWARNEVYFLFTDLRHSKSLSLYSFDCEMEIRIREATESGEDQVSWWIFLHSKTTQSRMCSLTHLRNIDRHYLSTFNLLRSVNGGCFWFLIKGKSDISSTAVHYNFFFGGNWSAVCGISSQCLGIHTLTYGWITST